MTPWRTPDHVPLPTTRVAVCWAGVLLIGNYYGTTFKSLTGLGIPWKEIDCWAFPHELMPEEFRDYPGPANETYHLTPRSDP